MSFFQKIHNLVFHTFSLRTIGIIKTLLIVLAIVLTINVVQQQQTMKQGASEEMSVSNFWCKVDYTQSPSMKSFANTVANLCAENYPKIEQLLNNASISKPYRIIIREQSNPGGTSGSIIYLSGEWFTSNPDDLGAVVHEMTHVIQAYPSYIFWPTEGIADYIRYWAGYQNSWSYPHCGQGQNYTIGYSCSAAFLRYIERSYDKNIVSELNNKLREGNYSDSLFQIYTGKKLPELWTECLSSECKNGILIPSPTPTNTPTPTPSPTPSPTPTSASIPTPTRTPSPTPTGVPTTIPSITPFPTSTDTPSPTPTNTPSPVTVTIQGRYVDANGNALATDIGQAISLNIGLPDVTGLGVWDFSRINPGTYTVTANLISGYTISYSICLNCSPPPSSYVLGNTVNVNLPQGGDYADIYFKYTPIPAPTLSPTDIPTPTPTSAPSPTLTLLPTSAPTKIPIFGDIDKNNELNILDYNLLIGCWNKTNSTTVCIPSDLNRDGMVNQFDYNALIREFVILSKK
jgi:hypothetical protein